MGSTLAIIQMSNWALASRLDNTELTKFHLASYFATESKSNYT